MAITIYTKTGCPFCVQALESLNEQNVSYNEINVSDDPNKVEELEGLAGEKKVPVFVENETVTVGFNGGA